MFETHKDTSRIGFTVDHREDGIIVYRMVNVRRETIDSWVQAFQQHEEEALAENRHLRRLMDIRGAGLPTPYAIAKAVEVVSNDPEGLRESYAILVGDSMTSQILSNSLRHLRKWISNTSLFTDEQTALHWLDERLAELGE
jgi:hypothetical protein